MAVAFDAVGPSSAGAGNTSSATLNWTHPAGAVSGRAILVGLSVDAAADGGLTAAVTCAGVTMTSLAKVHSNSGTSGYLQVFGLTGVGTGTLAIACTVSGGSPNDLEGGSLSFSGAGGFGTPATGVSAGTTSTATAALASNASGNLIAGFAAAGDSINSATAPSTSRFIKNEVAGAGDSTGNIAGATSPATGSSVTMAWALNSATFFAEVLAEVLPVPAQQPPVPLPQLPPGWFPGADKVTTQPGGVPFWAQPAPADATPAVIIPPTPEPDPVRPVAPGWFPGADKVTAVPGGIPFSQLPPPQTATQPVIFPVPEVAGIPDWQPLPPGWFPGASQVTTDPGSIPFYSLPQPLTPPPAPPPVPVVSGLGGTGYNSWFTDQFGNPRLMVIEQAWLLPSNGGRWNSGNWRSDMDAYFVSRARQGYTAWYGIAWNNIHIDTTSLSGGRTWDGIYPLVVNGTPGAIATGSETVSLNDPFWQRIDYLFASARQQGIACFLNISQSYDISSAGSVWQHATNTQGTAFGAALTARYPQSAYSHVFWFFGDDDDGPNDSFYQAILTGMQGAGDTRALISDEQFTNTNCHIEFDDGTAFGGTFGVPNSTYNWVYSYDAPYFGCEDSYKEGGTFPHIPPVYGDGVYYGDSGSGTTPDRAIRNFVWWSLSSGSRGFPSTSGPSLIGVGPTSLWQWASNSVAALTTDPNGTFTTSAVGAIAKFFAGLADWNKLIPDTGNVFITAGRGTRGTCDAPGGVFNFRNTNTYVAGSITPAGTLAVIYCKAAMSITIDQTKMAAGYTAMWVDPLSLATQSATPGTTFSSSGLGNNSAGDPDWVLVLQGTAASSVSAPAGLATGTGAAEQPQVAITVNAGLATGTGAALAPTAAAGANAVLATGTGTAPAPTVSEGINAALATGTGTAQQPLIAITVNAGLATGIGAALQPTVSTSGSTNAPAGLATGTGAAPAPSIAITANGGVATGTGTAPAPAASAGANAGLAAGTGTAPAASIAVTVIAGLPAGTGAALQPSVQTSAGTNAHAGLATAAGAALTAALQIAANAQAATALGAALNTVPSFQVARSAATVAPAVTSAATVTDPRDGTATVTAPATSTPTVS